MKQEEAVEKAKEFYDLRKDSRTNNNGKVCIYIHSEKDISSITKDTKTVFIEGDYKGQYSKVFKAIGDNPHIKSLLVRPPIETIMLDDENLIQLETLSFVLCSNDIFNAFSLPNLKYLCIYGDGKRPDLLSLVQEPVTIDFSFFPSLERLKIEEFNNLDCSSFKTLKSIKELTFNYIVTDNLNWLQNLPQLESFTFSADGIFSVQPIIDFQPGIKKLFLRFTKLSDADKLITLDSIEYLDILYCHISSEQERALRQMNIPYLCINDFDYIVHGVERTALELYQDAVQLLLNRESYADFSPPFVKERAIKERNRDWTERFIEAMQFVFENKWKELYHDEKYSYTPKINDLFVQNKEELCRRFLHEVIKDFPFIKMPSEIIAFIEGNAISTVNGF